MTIRDGVSYKTLLAEANAMIEVVSAKTLMSEFGPTSIDDIVRDDNVRDDIVLIDLRDIRELEREGQLPGAVHTPRGMLEFWIDPDSPYAKPIFQQDKRFVFYCQSGWRSALACATAVRLGLQRASHLEGGFNAWKDAGGEVIPYVKKQR